MNNCKSTDFKYLSSKANAEKRLFDKGAIDVYNKIINLEIFNDLALQFLEFVKKEFNLDPTSVISGRFGDSVIFNNDVFRKVDKVRGYDKINAENIRKQLAALEKPTQEVKPGVQELFDSNPELANIGTQQLYSQYLDTIFPDSKVKDIVYHGTKGYDFSGREKPKFDKFDKSFIGKGQGLRSDDMAKGFYFGSYKIADRVGTRIIPVILNIEEENTTTVRRNAVDFDTTGDVFVVFEPEQIHILGNKQDIEGFKEFVEKGEVEKKPRINYEKFINLKPSSKITKEEWKELTQEEQEVLMFQAENC